MILIKWLNLCFGCFFSDSDSWCLTLDRTNWKWGKANINILTLGIVYKGTAIPIYWELLDKRGNSDYAERIALLKKFIEKFGKEKISDLLCDREMENLDLKTVNPYLNFQKIR